MKSPFSMDPSVPLSRALREHRAWLVPLALVLIVNAVLLVAVVMPLSRGVAGNEQRAQAAQTALAAGERDLKDAEALRDGKVQATSDLDVFYREVLPGDVSAARRLTHVKLAHMATEHNVLYERGSTTLERLKESTLGRLHVQMVLTGEYADVRSFLHTLETASDFVVIDNILLSEGKGETRDTSLSLTLEVSTYYPAPAGTNAP
jgi:Tfp pilus assembly protein PilO